MYQPAAVGDVPRFGLQDRKERPDQGTLHVLGDAEPRGLRRCAGHSRYSISMRRRNGFVRDRARRGYHLRLSGAAGRDAGLRHFGREYAEAEKVRLCLAKTLHARRINDVEARLRGALFAMFL